MTTITWNLRMPDQSQMFCVLADRETIHEMKIWLSENVKGDFECGPVNHDERGHLSMSVTLWDDREAMLFKLAWKI